MTNLCSISQQLNVLLMDEFMKKEVKLLVKAMITNTQMLQYVDCENDCESRPWVSPGRDFQLIILAFTTKTSN